MERLPWSSAALRPNRPKMILILWASTFVGKNTKQWSLKVLQQRAKERGGGGGVIVEGGVIV